MLWAGAPPFNNMLCGEGELGSDNMVCYCNETLHCVRVGQVLFLTMQSSSDPFLSKFTVFSTIYRLNTEKPLKKINNSFFY